MSLAAIDWAILSAYAGLLIFIAYRLRDAGGGDSESYILNSRRLTLPSFVATTVSTWYGGILGVGEYTYKHGISNWLVFGVPYYLAAFIFAVFLSERAQRSRLTSIPDQLESAYGGRVAAIGAIYVFITTVPAAYVLMMGVLLSLIMGWSLVVSAMVAAAVSCGYVVLGGFRSVVKTDLLQFSLMFGGFAVIMILLFSNYGGWSALKSSLPAGHFDWRGGATTGYVFSWYLIALAALVEPAFYQRCYAAKSPAVARRGLLLSIGFWCVFDFMTTSTGLYSRMLLGEGIEAVHSFPLLADKILPAGVKGLFLLGLLTTIQSTIDSYAFLAATTLGRDVLWRVKRIRLRLGMVALSRWCLLAVGALAVVIAVISQSVVDIWHTFGSFSAPGLALPLAFSYSARLRYRPGWALTHIVIVPAVVALWYAVRSTVEKPAFPWSLESIYPGFAASILIWLIDHAMRTTRVDFSKERNS